LHNAAGFFAATTLDRSRPGQPGETRIEASTGSSDPFADWHGKASVRRAPRREIRREEASLDLFPRDLVPYIEHPIIRRGFAERIPELLAYAAYRYLTFTINLETQVVNETNLSLMRNDAPMLLNPASCLDAHRLYCDEAFHALISADLMKQAIEVSGIAPVEAPPPCFLARLDEVARQTGGGRMSRFVFTSVSEMLITGTLNQVRRGDATPEAVRAVMMDHAADEARHHVFFRHLLTSLLQSIGRDAAIRVAASIPASIRIFTQPDVAAIECELVQVGVGRDTARQICFETFRDEDVMSQAADSARGIVELVRRLELLREPRVFDAFAASRLLPPPV
jgi:hypothetical protein